ncbi:hypothetical protein XA68_18071 [Ophiocordyceps unilateralis]|uniref:glycerol kinase n=1 Tax=Ophiocordyceps unilateralis TaxID=268505 RepID=A0A2A9P3T1_OPHUN|nr:hypothetical protein XA68_18071 [Ophiocordyceps unilateralis]
MNGVVLISPDTVIVVIIIDSDSDSPAYTPILIDLDLDPRLISAPLLILTLTMSPSTPPAFVGAIDQGTTSSRFLIFNRRGEVVALHQLEFGQIYPKPGWHEHDADELVSSVEACIDGAVAKFESQGHSREQIVAVGITNQRETTVVWDRETGKALHNAIVWTDTRTQDLVRRLKGKIGAGELTARCGLPLSTYPSVGKILWLLENVPAVREAYHRRVLAFGTVDAWLTYRLNDGPARNVHVTDPTNASRTMFMNLRTLDYDADLLDWFRIDRDKLALPRIVRSADAHAYGSLAGTTLKGVRITGCLGDQSAALVGQKAFTPGLAKNTYGTGCFLLYNVGDEPVISSHGLLTTVAFDLGQGMTKYALEGSIAVAGSSVKFLVDNLGFIDSSARLSALAETVEDNGGCTFVTAFSGLFAPYWIDDARGTIFGITAYTQKGHIARATLEATCFQTKAILDAMEKDSDAGRPHRHPRLAAGVWESVDDLRLVNTEGRSLFRPTIGPDEASSRFARWEKAVQMSRGWANY